MFFVKIYARDVIDGFFLLKVDESMGSKLLKLDFLLLCALKVKVILNVFEFLEHQFDYF